MEDNYHGILVDKGFFDESVLNKLRIIGSKQTSKWKLIKIAVKEDELDDVIKKLQEKMIKFGYYFHLYRGDELIVCYKDKIFRVSPDKSTWARAVEYGKELKIPNNELVFSPVRIEDETY